MRHNEQPAPTITADRLRRLEDRNAISERTIKYARSIDAGDWDAYASCFSDPVYIDFSKAGMPVKSWVRAEFVEFSRQGLEGFATRQHLSPNHIIEFDESDRDRATCFSYMYAQHHLPDATGGDFYLMRGTYTADMVRAEEGWVIERLVQDVTWLEGNLAAPTQAAARFKK